MQLDSFLLKSVLVDLVNDECYFHIQFFHTLCCCLLVRGLVSFLLFYV